jgi:hypothetical protein
MIHLPAWSILLLALLVSGCRSETGNPLPAAEFPARCRGLGVEATLEGDEADPRVAWLVHESGDETRLVWPPGWSARFAPSLEILDDRGRVRMRAGDHVSNACLKGTSDDPSSVMMVEGLVLGP